MLYDDQSERRRGQSYLFWFIIFSLLFHFLLFLLFIFFGFESNSLNRFKDFFDTHKEPTIIVFHDDKHKQAESPMILEQVQKEMKEIEKEVIDSKPLNTPIIKETMAKLSAPISSFGYKDAEKEASFDVEIPDSQDGLIENVVSAPIIQTEKKKIVEMCNVKPAQDLQKNYQQSKLEERIRSIGKNMQDKNSNSEIIFSDQNDQKLDFIVDHSEIKVRGAKLEEKKPANKKNILALTKGFVEKLFGEDGTDMIDRDGDPNIKPSFEELKFIGYEAKINWALQASWKQNFERNSNKKATPGVVDISFIIDSQGIPQNITIVRSSGHLELDQTIVCNIKSAAPFPPIPAHLKMVEYPVRRSIQVFLYGRSF